VILYMCSHHGHQVHVLLMMLIILVVELLQETFVEMNSASPTFFNGHHTSSQKMFKSCIFFSFFITQI